MNVSDAAATIVEIIIQRSPMREAIVNENANESVRKLVTAWILNCPNNGDAALRSRLNIVAPVSAPVAPLR